MLHIVKRRSSRDNDRIAIFYPCYTAVFQFVLPHIIGSRFVLNVNNDRDGYVRIFRTKKDHGKHDRILPAALRIDFHRGNENDLCLNTEGRLALCLLLPFAAVRARRRFEVY